MLDSDLQSLVAGDRSVERPLSPVPLTPPLCPPAPGHRAADLGLMSVVKLCQLLLFRIAEGGTEPVGKCGQRGRCDLLW